MLQICKGNISFKLQKADTLFEGQTYPISCFAFIQKTLSFILAEQKSKLLSSIWGMYVYTVCYPKLRQKRSTGQRFIRK